MNRSGTTHPWGASAAAGMFLLAWVVCAVPASGTADDKDDKKTVAQAVVAGTVFTREGFALRGIRVAIRHKDDKKPKWKAVTDARGEFVLRLPRASGEYEITAGSKNYQNETRSITIEAAERFNLIFRLRNRREQKED